MLIKKLTCKKDWKSLQDLGREKRKKKKNMVGDGEEFHQEKEEAQKIRKCRFMRRGKLNEELRN